MPPTTLPAGASPLSQDVVFPEGVVRMRPGLLNFFSGSSVIPSSAAVNGLKSYTTPAGLKQLMLWDSLGNIYQENPAGTLNLIFPYGTAGLNMNGTSVFGRSYMGFFDGVSGRDLCRQFDGTNYDVVSQCGPGAPPSAAANFLPASVAISGSSTASATLTSATSSGFTEYWQYIGGPPNERGSYQLIKYYANATYTASAALPAAFAEGAIVTVTGVSNSFFNVLNAVIIAVTSTTFTVVLYSSTLLTATGGSSSVGGAAMQRSGGILTVNTGSTPHGFQTGWDVNISGAANIAIGGGSISSISQSSGVGTCVTPDPHFLVVNALAAISGTSNYNGTYVVLSVPSPTSFTFAFLNNVASESAGTVSTVLNTTASPILSVPTATSFTIAQLGPNITTTESATASIVGNVGGGNHQVSVAFITRQGYYTRPSPALTFSAIGGQLVSLTGIPTGPSNIVGRLIIFTPTIVSPATTGTFFALLPAMVIQDNTTTAAIFDFSDTILQAGTNYQYLFTQVVLGESANVQYYNGRLAWCGERQQVPNLLNMSFEGGWDLGSGTGGSDVPLGWTSDPTYGAGGSRATSLIFGDAYQITGDGTHIRGMITQPAWQDWLNAQIISINTQYSIRLRAWVNTPSATGTLGVDLYSPSLGILGTCYFAVASMGTSPQEFIGTVLSSQVSLPPDITLRLYTTNNVPAGISVTTDNLEVFLTNAPVNTGQARLSYAFNQESYDGTTSIVSVRPLDGQSLRASFVIRGVLYLAKDRYLASVTDDGINEPSFWPVTEVSSTVGVCGPNAVDFTEEWAALACRNGLYIFWGSDPVKVSDEIFEDVTGSGKITWSSINWDLAQLVWVKIDLPNKRILVGAPTGSSTVVNTIFCLSFKFQMNGESIAEALSPNYSTFTGKLLYHGSARRWSYWNVTAASAEFSERPDGTAHLFFGNGAGNGLVYDVLDSQKSDNGVAINPRYQIAAAPFVDDEQAMQLGAHRKLCDYLTGRVIGSGAVNIVATSPYRQTAIRAVTLTVPSDGIQVPDFERNVNIHGERIVFEYNSNSPNVWWQLEKHNASFKKDPALPARGLSN